MYKFAISFAYICFIFLHFPHSLRKTNELSYVQWVCHKVLFLCLHGMIINYHKWQCAKGQILSFITDILFLALLLFVTIPVRYFLGTSPFYYSHCSSTFNETFFLLQEPNVVCKTVEISHQTLTRKSSRTDVWDFKWVSEPFLYRVQ